MANQDKPGRIHRRLELRKSWEQVWSEIEHDDQLRPNWHIILGAKLSIPIRLGSVGFSWLYVALDMVAFAFGVACIFIGPSWRELGIALIVGAMFAIGSFIGQILSTQMGIERHQSDLLWRDRLIQRYADRLAALEEEIQVLGKEGDDVS